MFGTVGHSVVKMDTPVPANDAVCVARKGSSEIQPDAMASTSLSCIMLKLHVFIPFRKKNNPIWLILCNSVASEAALSTAIEEDMPHTGQFPRRIFEHQPHICSALSQHEQCVISQIIKYFSFCEIQ